MNCTLSERKIVIKSGAKYIQNNYEIQGIIGQGGFGKVYKAKKIINGKPVALKMVMNDKISEYYFDEEILQKVPMEAVLLAKCQGIPGIIKLLEIVKLDEYDAWCIIMERNPNSIDLFDFISRSGEVSEKTAVYILNQVLHTVIGCYKAGVTHRDIKDENILIDIHTKEIKLIDFGSGSLYHEGEYDDFIGTPIYSSPEWVTEKHYFAKQLETWSIGALLFTMITGDVPFKTDDEILTSPVFAKSASDECQDLISSCLCRDREKRIDLDNILSHKLFQKYHLSIGIEL